MSIRVMTAVWSVSRQKGSALLALLAVADFAHDDGSGAYPSIATLARKIRMSERQTTRLLNQLEEAGELLIARGAGPAGTHVLTVRPGAAPALDEELETPGPLAPGPLAPGPVDNSVEKAPGRGDKLSMSGDAPRQAPVTPVSPKPSSIRQERTLKPAPSAGTVDKSRTMDARDAFADAITERMTAISARIRDTDDEAEREELIDELDKLRNLAPTSAAGSRRRGGRDLTKQCEVCSADPGMGCLDEIHALVASAPPPPTAADRAKAAAIAGRLAEGLPPYADEEKPADGEREMTEFELRQHQAKVVRLWAEQATHVRNPYSDQDSKNILANLAGRLIRAGAPPELVFSAIREYGSTPTANPAHIGQWLKQAEVGREINAHLARKAAEKAAAVGKGRTGLVGRMP